MRKCLSLLTISVFLGACTLDSQNLKRMQRDTPKNTLADLPRDTSVDVQKAGSDKLGLGRSGPYTAREGSPSVMDVNKVGQGSKDQEAAVPEVDLTNFKERLGSLSGAEVIELMGIPEFERSEPPARIWQYRAPICVVDLFLYNDGGTLAVEYVGLRTREAVRNVVNERVCFASIIQKPVQNTGEVDPGAGPGEGSAREPYISDFQTGAISSIVRQKDEIAAPKPNRQAEDTPPFPGRAFD